MIGDNKEKLVEGLDRIRDESLHRIDRAVDNINRAFESEFPSDTIGEQVGQMIPSGPEAPASEDMGGLRARIELLHRDDDRKAA
jgi:hypothetical protein